MREIKFRGKKVEDELWTTGYLIRYGRKAWILHPEGIVSSHYDILGKWVEREIPRAFVVEVIPETVGQFTGLHDKNGKEIYEGDIVLMKEGDEFWICKVIYDPPDFVAVDNKENRYFLKHFNPKIIGNIYDNPELLEK